ncbi:IBR domain containing protein [Pyrenophora tritici-repentis]|nr:IBR domain containing protein [Pyrenophora tritici-repentis]
MASFTPNDNTLSNAPHPDDIDIAPRICGYCNEYLAITDKAKSSGRYWKGCKRCLDERAAKEQKRIIFKRAKAELNIDIATRHGGRCSYDFRTDDEQDNEETFFIKQETSSALDPSSFCKYNAGDTSDDTNLETAECTVCTLPYSTHTFLALPSCTHPPSVCSTCFIEWLTTQIPNLQPIPCPSTACTTFLSHTGIHTHAPLPLFTRYDDLTMRSLLSSDPSFLYCLNPSCTSGQIHDSGTAGPIFRCAECGFKMCTAHEPVVPFHEDETCAVYVERVERERQEREARQEEDEKRRREEEEASREAVKRDAVECPGCGVMIHKMAGCDHMTCRRKGCRFEFCYICRAPYKRERGIWKVGNSAHEKEITDPQTPAYKGCEEHFQDPVDRKKDGNWYVNCITCRNKAKAIRRREKAAYGMCFGQKKNHASQGNIHDEEPGSEDAL